MGPWCEIHCAVFRNQWQNNNVPRIHTATLAEHRDWRRSQLIEAAAAIALESGSQAITVAAVAERAGLSRTSIYEYFGSSAELIADLLIDEMQAFTDVLSQAVTAAVGPEDAIAKWITASLTYIADGNHLLAKSLNAAEIPREKSQHIGAAHRAMFSPLLKSLQELGVSDGVQALALLQAATDVATKRIENGGDAAREIEKTTAFCIAGVKALI
jgi:AcrR family transcriptional regulator